MTLEDFFTLAEMKDGLTASTRVEELINVMQKEKECFVKNASDATRQWSAVASTIAATENRDCLDLFIQLDGLWFIDRWLKDAQNFGDGTSDSFVEESITALLRALEKLHIDHEKSMSSGIWITVKSLLGHKSSMVQRCARALFGNWEQGGDGDKVNHDAEKKIEEIRDSAMFKSARHSGGSYVQDYSPTDASGFKQSSNEDYAMETASNNILASRSSDNLQVEKTGDVDVNLFNDKFGAHKDLDSSHVDGVHSVPSGCSAGLDFVEKSSSMKELPACPVVSIETSSPATKQENLEEEKSECLKLNKVVIEANHAREMKTSAGKLVADDIYSAKGELEPRTVLLSDHAADVLDSMMEPVLKNKTFNVDNIDCCPETNSHDGVNLSIAKPRDEVDHGRSMSDFQTTDKSGECHSSVLQSSVLQDSSDSECVLGKDEDGDSSSSSLMEDTETVTNFRERPGRENPSSASEFFRPASNTTDGEMADMELECGLVDPLEVARKVAEEVEREVQYKEPFCSTSSEKLSEGGIKQPSSPDSISGKENEPSKVSTEGAPNGQNLSPMRSPKEEQGQIIESTNLSCEAETHTVDMDSSQVTEAAQKQEVNDEKGFCDFDLNQDVCFEEMDYSENPSTATVSIVSASRPAAASRLPATPLQFVGTLGWKGSASTSAFRPASPCKIQDEDMAFNSVGSSSSKHKHGFLDFDLNVADGADDETIDSVVVEQMSAVSPGFHSRKSSGEMSPKRSGKLSLDLNRISDDGDALPSGEAEVQPLFPCQNGYQVPSLAASSSSMPSTWKNIDLNDPTVCHESLDSRPRLGKSLQEDACASSKPGDPVFPLRGMRVDASRKEYAPHTFSVFQNGRVTEPAIETGSGRMGGLLGLGTTASYAQHPLYGFNGFAGGPVMSFSSPMYGPANPFPYMIDSRVAPVVPQIVATTSSSSPSYPQPPFIMSMNGTPLGLNVAGPSRPSFDLNSGFMMEGGNGGLRQFFGHDDKLVDERVRGSSQTSLGLSIGEKRKEPDAGWETYRFSDKHQQPPWK